MIPRITTTLLVALALASCEVPVDVDLPHTERLVVDGFVGLTSDNSELRVLRTLPPLSKVDVSKMIVPDASVRIEWKGNVYPLERSADSTTFLLPDASTSWDDGIARLTVKGAGKTATASTRIPKRPAVLSTRVVDTISTYGAPTTYLLVDLEVDTGTVVWSTDEYSFTGDRRPMSHYATKQIAPSSSPSGRSTMRLVAFESYNGFMPDSITISIFSADHVWDRYLRTPYGGGEGLFGFSGTNPFFNITGEGIGLFIGASSTKIGVRLR